MKVSRKSADSAASMLLIVAVSLVLTIGLQGCGGGGGPTPAPPGPTPAPPGPTPGPTPAPSSWKLAPIEVKGSHMYDSKTGKEFHAVGIGFPNVGPKADIKEWIAVLQRIRKKSDEINTIRIYEPPECAVEQGSTCFAPFMREADKLGIYVLVPGSGTVWGYFPGIPKACDPPISEGLQGCYQGNGNILGWGRTIVNNFQYPNTLAIILANEIEQNMPALPVLKAYARDMKAHMDVCNTDQDSPSKGVFRPIPLMYAATDKGNKADWAEADYLFCGDKSASIDIFGLNVERWIDDTAARPQYDEINKDVLAKKWPGAYMHSEEGGPYGGNYPATPTWGQLPGFFHHWPAIDGFAGYAYYGNPQYNMYDGTSADAKELPDGTQFFAQLQQVGANPPDTQPAAVVTPECATSILSGTKTYDLLDFQTAKIYATGDNGWAKNCPKPLEGVARADNAELIV